MLFRVRRVSDKEKLYVDQHGLNRELWETHTV